MIGAVCFSDVRGSERYVLHTDDDVLVGDVEFDVATKVVDDFFVGSYSNVANNSLHARQLVVR